MNVVAYLRVSTEDQSNGDKFGLDVQREQIINYCSENDLTIIKWYEDHISGVKEERPAFNEILFGNIHNPPVEAVVVASNDRIARDIEVYYYYKMLLRKKDIKLISVKEDFGKFGAFRELLESFTLTVAKMERENINLRTTSGRLLKAKNGGYAGGRVPYGYSISDGMYVINRDEEMIVKKIFQLYDSGMSLRNIAVKMNELGYKTRKGKAFLHSTIDSVVKNRKMYEGMYRYAGCDWVKGQHEAILKNDNKE